MGDVLTTADERGEDHVDVVLNTESEIGLILLRQGWEINICVGKIDTLLGRDLSVVAGTGSDGLLIDNGQDVESKNSVIDVDDTSWLNDLGDVLVIDVPGEYLLVGTYCGRFLGKLTCSCHRMQLRISHRW